MRKIPPVPRVFKLFSLRSLSGVPAPKAHWEMVDISFGSKAAKVRCKVYLFHSVRPVCASLISFNRLMGSPSYINKQKPGFQYVKIKVSNCCPVNFVSRNVKSLKHPLKSESQDTSEAT